MNLAQAWLASSLSQTVGTRGSGGEQGRQMFPCATKTRNGVHNGGATARFWGQVEEGATRSWGPWDAPPQAVVAEPEPPAGDQGFRETSVDRCGRARDPRGWSQGGPGSTEPFGRTGVRTPVLRDEGRARSRWWQVRLQWQRRCPFPPAVGRGPVSRHPQGVRGRHCVCLGCSDGSIEVTCVALTCLMASDGADLVSSVVRCPRRPLAPTERSFS